MSERLAVITEDKLPEPGTYWQNKILAEKPFGPDQKKIDDKAEALSPQGLNLYQVVHLDTTTREKRVYYFEVGQNDKPASSMPLKQFTDNFLPVAPTSALLYKLEAKPYRPN